MTIPLLFHQLSTLTTERVNASSRNIDSLSILDGLALINREDRKVALAVRRELPAIARAVKLIVNAFRNEGRLLYVGAGTSGRLGILDASECPPTFGTPRTMVEGLMAGGREAVFASQEGVEDDRTAGAREVRRARVNNNDVVCGVAASMRTPYVHGALAEAKRRGARTILVTTNPRKLLRGYPQLRKSLDVAICIEVGPEVIMGSTRMKAGTAQKMVLNMLSTMSMVRIGKVFGNMMVDLKMNSRKLEERAKRVLMLAAKVDYATAERALHDCDGHVKTALVMIRGRMTAAEATAALVRSRGFVRGAISRQTHTRRSR
jgi:N-acetylmuramic acid 6-phosphate etherase